MIKLRLDVDYAYPSRIKSFLYTAFNIKRKSNDYLKNAKIIANMINETQREIKAYWFFTPYTIPDKELLDKLDPVRHEVALHVANNPYEELEALQKATNRKVKYYTVHGTERLLGKVIWRRKLNQARVDIPDGFPLQSFYVFPFLGLDFIAHTCSVEEAVKQSEETLAKGNVLFIHPEWLFQKGKINHRGPYYEPLRRILDVDRELDCLSIHKIRFFKIAQKGDVLEYIKESNFSEQFIHKLKDRNVDVYSFIERSWLGENIRPLSSWVKDKDNIALLSLASYDEWLAKVGKKTRNMIRKAEKSGVQTCIVEPNEKLAKGIWQIYNETPIRQGRAFPHYGASLESVTDGVLAAKECIFIGAYFEGALVGFIQLMLATNFAVISQILSLQKHWDKAVNNALIAKMVEVCSDRGIKYVMYGRMGNHPSLDSFKQSNNFEECVFSRYFIPLSKKGWLAIKLHLHKPLKDTLPMWLKKPLFPLFNFISRYKTSIKNK